MDISKFCKIKIFQENGWNNENWQVQLSASETEKDGMNYQLDALFT